MGAATPPPLPARRPRIVHVSGDFPDPLVPGKTPVIRTLLELTANGFAHDVVSLNRVTPRWRDLCRKAIAISEQVAFDGGVALRYAAPGRGLWHARMLHRLGHWLADYLADDPPDLLVGHKLTIEGLAVARAADLLGRPYALSLQGNTDGKILAARPDLRGLFARVFHGAAEIFPFAPWTLHEVEQRLGARPRPSAMLPCPTDLDQPLAPNLPGDGFVSAFHLRHHRNKNLAGLVAAHSQLRAEGMDLPLEIIGGGAPSDVARCREIAARNGAVRFAGALDREALRRRLNRATAFVLPSHRESFGLVYIEALFAGLPIIYPRGAAVDGYFDGCAFALKVDAEDRASIAAAMREMAANEAALKQSLREWQGSAHAQGFTRGAIAGRFASGLQKALAAPPASGENAA